MNELVGKRVDIQLVAPDPFNSFTIYLYRATVREVSSHGMLFLTDIEEKNNLNNKKIPEMWLNPNSVQVTFIRPVE